MKYREYTGKWNECTLSSTFWYLNCLSERERRWPLFLHFMGSVMDTFFWPEHTKDFVEPQVTSFCGGDIFSHRFPLFSSFANHTCVATVARCCSFPPQTSIFFGGVLWLAESTLAISGYHMWLLISDTGKSVDRRCVFYSVSYQQCGVLFVSTARIKLSISI